MGLSDPLKDDLARVGVPQSLDALLNPSIQIDRCLRERRSETGQSRRCYPESPAAFVPNASEPMQLGLLRPSLTAEEHQRHRQNNLCLHCGDLVQQSFVSAYQFHLPIPQLCLTTLLTSLFPFCYSFQEEISRSLP